MNLSEEVDLEDFVARYVYAITIADPTKNYTATFYLYWLHINIVLVGLTEYQEQILMPFARKPACRQ